MADPRVKLSEETRRGLVRGSTLGVGVLLVAVLLAMANYFGWKYHTRFDWTKSKIYTLSEKSRNVLASLDHDIDVVVFLNPGTPLYDPVHELLERYQAASKHIHVRFLDPDRNPLEAKQLVQKYDVKGASVVFASGDDRRVLQEADLADYDYSGLQMGQEPRMTGFKGEQLFTGAILELAEQHKPKVLFTTGHGELKLDERGAGGLSKAREVLGEDNFVIQEWASLGKPAVPDGTDLLVIAGPTSTFVEPELLALTDYLRKGGRILVLLDPTLRPAGGLVDTGLGEWLADYGVEVGDDIVVDPTNPIPFFGAETFFVKQYGDHTITRSLKQAGVPVLVSLMRSVSAAKNPPDGYKVTQLLLTSPQGWGERDLAHLSSDVSKGPDDLAGPVSLGVAVEKDEASEPAAEEGSKAGASDDKDKAAAATDTADSTDSTEAAKDEGKPAPAAKMRLVVFGDSDFASNRLLEANASNEVLLSDTLNWLVERQAHLGIPPKTPEQVRLSLDHRQFLTITLLVLLVLPGAAILLGVGVYFRRRR